MSYVLTSTRTPSRPASQIARIAQVGAPPVASISTKVQRRLQPEPVKGRPLTAGRRGTRRVRAIGPVLVDLCGPTLSPEQQEG
jgi:hypothetical protein